MAEARVRLYLDHPLGAGQTVPLSRDQAHYLGTVMRLRPGDALAVFNGCDGEWRAMLCRGATLHVTAQTAPQRNPPDLWLLFAPIKKARTDFIVEKAAELGAARIMPILTERSQSRRIARDRLQAHAIEAAEQCGGTFVPPVDALRPLGDVLADWPPERQLMFCDEALAGRSSALAGDLAAAGAGDVARQRGGACPWAILIGPEGGFADAERARLAALAFAHPVRLGPRILRADTATVAALTLWQDRLGDWR
jgi:16S rRNA (uracil1498-N3)-methyltransferase